MYNLCDRYSSCPFPSTGAASQTFASALQFLAAAQCLITENWPPDADVRSNEEFNYIIVGAGTAGSVVANRLSELKDKSVLVIEAGGDPPVESIITSMSVTMIGTKYDWNFVGTTDGTNEAYNNSIFHLPRGKFLGGCSSINGMAYFKGCSGDYQLWKKAAGNDDWSPEIASKYFKKAESLQNQEMLQNPAVRENYGINGYLVINRFNNSYREIYDSVMGAWDEIGIKKQEDLNSANLNGCGQMTAFAADGVRWSTAKAYLIPARDRPNLKVLKNALVTKILIDNTTKNANGVEVVRNDRTLTFLAKDEVIVSAGALNTPQLLMLSGIGPKTHLESKNLSVVVDSPMVGQNLQDHIEIPITIYGKGPSKDDVKDTIHFDAIQYLFDRTGNLVLNNSDIVSFYSKTNNATCPEFQNHFGVYYQNSSDLVRSWLTAYNALNPSIVNSTVALNKNYTLFLFRFHLLHPFSKGNISLKTNNPRDHAIIYTNYLSDQRDIEAAVKGIKRISSNIINTAYFKSIGGFLGRLSWPPCDDFELDSDDYWKCICKHMVLPFYHHMGTARMGTNIKNSVVDSKLRVHGVGKLRVVDASVVPTTISGNPTGPIIMIAERVSDMIKDDL